MFDVLEKHPAETIMVQAQWTAQETTVCIPQQEKKIIFL